MSDVTLTSKEKVAEPMFLRSYAEYLRKPHEAREQGIKESYLHSCADEMEAAADELERLRSAHEPCLVEPDGYIRYSSWNPSGDDPEQVFTHEFASREEPHEGEGWVPLYARASDAPAEPTCLLAAARAVVEAVNRTHDPQGWFESLALLKSEVARRAGQPPRAKLSTDETRELLGAETPIHVGDLPTDPLGMQHIPGLVGELIGGEGGATGEHDLLEALKDANDKCRSAYQIAKRIVDEHGAIYAGTNFSAFKDRVHESLVMQRTVLEAHGAYSTATKFESPE